MEERDVMPPSCEVNVRQDSWLGEAERRCVSGAAPSRGGGASGARSALDPPKSAFTQIAKNSLFGVVERTGFTDLLQRAGGGRNRLYVLAYHRVCNPLADAARDPALISAAPAQFEEQMDLLSRRYHPVSADMVLDAAQHGVPLPRDAVLVTFDDGYRDFQDVAFPILQQYRIRPVLFVATGIAGRSTFWWDELHHLLLVTPHTEIPTPLGPLPLRTPTEREDAVRRWRAYITRVPFEQARSEIAALYAAVPGIPGPSPTLDWDQLRLLSGAGVTIAAHTHTHPILSHISPEAARKEIRLSQSIVAREIGRALPIFAYPDGRVAAISSTLAAILREEGFLLAFTMIEGRARLEQDNPLLLPRIGTRSSLTTSTFHAHLTPGYDLWKRGRRWAYGGRSMNDIP